MASIFRFGRIRAAVVMSCSVLCAAAVCQTAHGQTQNFDSAPLGSLPSGWSQSVVAGTAPANPAPTAWAVVNTQSHSVSNSAFTNDVAGTYSQYLVLPVLTATGPVRIDFWKRFQTEATFDGLVVEIDINGSGFTNIGQAAWSLNGYNQAAISTQYQSPIAGQPAFSGAGLTWTESIATVDASNGDQVTIRFNMSSDSSVASTGVWLDDINITTGPGGACCLPALGICTVGTSAVCTSSGGTFQGLATSCPGPCPAAGACCDTTTGACTLLGEAGCLSPSAFSGAGSTCTPINPCSGACCNALSGGCTLTGSDGCVSPSQFLGLGVVCTPTNPCPPPPPPANDECDATNPVVVVGTPQFGTNIQATQSATLTTVVGDAFCGQATFATGPQQDVFWQFTPTVSGTYDVNTCGSSFDTVLSVHSDCPADDSNKIACNDDSTFYTGYPNCANLGTNSRIPVVALTAGTTYHIRVGGYAGATGAIQLSVNTIQAGACCDSSTGACTGSITGSAGCAAGTAYQGNDTVCSPNPCGQGACCNGLTGACTLTVAAGCTSGNTFQGEASTCATVSCGQGACCNDATAACALSTTAGCVAGNTFQGETSTCTTGLCPVKACCNAATGACTTTGVTGTCPTDTIDQGGGSSCTFNPCPQPPTGACCIASTQTCTDVFGTTCATQGGVYQGDNTSCGSVPCPFGACCLPCVGCFVSTPEGCTGQGGTYNGDGSACESQGCIINNGGFETPTFAPAWSQFGDISFTAINAGAFGNVTPHGGTYEAHFGPTAGPGGISQIIPVHAGDQVTIGFWYAAAGVQNSFLAEFDGQTLVSFTNDTDHTAWTEFTFPVTVSADNPTLQFTMTNPPSYDLLDDITVCVSTPVTGVCCRGATCNTTVTSAADCESSLIAGQKAGAVFATSSSTCNSGPVSNTPCCYANYNKVNGISVQDIFDFLSDWFAGSRYANVGGDGNPAALSVQGLFNFLSDWFAGGC